VSRFAPLIRFGFVGAITAAIYAGLLALTIEGMRLPPPVGVGIGYVLALGFNYWAHHRWTFRTDRPHRSSAPRYLLLVGASFVVNVGATAVLPGLLGIDYKLVQAGLFAVLIVASFTGQSLWVFGRG
jgi:putative flippase GtrA